MSMHVIADAGTATPGTLAIESYTFDWDDGEVTGPQEAFSAEHTYVTPGTYTITVTVTDIEGNSDDQTFEFVADIDVPEIPEPDPPPPPGTLSDERGFRHEFTYEGVTRIVLPTADETQRLGSYQDRVSLAGGLISLTGTISEDEKNAHPEIYRQGAVWLVYDLFTQQYVMAGDLRDVAVSGGVASLTADGWGKRADTQIERFLLSNANLELWFAGDQDPLNFPGTARIYSQVWGNSLLFEVNRFTSFKKNANNKPAKWDGAGRFFWAPRTPLKWIHFDIAKTRNDAAYTLELVGTPTGPSGPLTVIQTWSLGAAGPSTVDYAIPGSYDLVGLRVSRSSEIKKAPHRRFMLRHLQIGAVATSTAFSIGDAYVELFDRLGATSDDVLSTTVNALPYDAAKVALGKIADDLALLNSWYWRMWVDPLDGTKQGEAGAIGSRVWHVNLEHTPVRPLPRERFNKVAFEFAYGGGYTAPKTVTATDDPFPPGFESTYVLDMDDPPIETIATQFAQMIVDYLVVPRDAGRALLYTVVDPNYPDVEQPAILTKPGDELILTNQGDKQVIIEEQTRAEDGSLVDTTFAEGNPLLDRWLAERQRRINMGLSSNQATLSLIDPAQPKAPAGVTLAFALEDMVKGKPDYAAIADWDAVTEDIEGNGTAVDTYHVWYRPILASDDTVIAHADGGGWRRHVVREPKDIDTGGDDDPLITTPTKDTLDNVPKPKKWKWECWVRAEDLLGQLSDWVKLPISVKPVNFHPLPPEDVLVYVLPHRVTVEFTAPEDPDDAGEDAPVRNVHPSVDHFQVQIDDEDPFDEPLKYDRHVSGEKQTFFVGSTRGKDFTAKVRSVDAYGNFSDWVSGSGAETPPEAPTGVNINFNTFEKHRHQRIRALVNWDEIVSNTEDLIHYIVQLLGTTPDDPTFVGSTVSDDRKEVDASRDDDPGGYAVANMGTVNKHRIYRARVRGVSAGNLKGPWSDWFPETGGADPTDHTAPPSPLNVKVYSNATNRVAVDWDPPGSYQDIEGTVSATSGTNTVTGSGTYFTVQTGLGDLIKIGAETKYVTAIASDTALTVNSNWGTTHAAGSILYTEDPDPDVAFYQVWIGYGGSPSAAFSPPAYKRDDYVHATKKSFKVADADEGNTFYVRVRSIDSSGNRSEWIPGTYAGNSDPDATAEGIFIGQGGGGFLLATFTKPGRVRVRDYPARWTNDTGVTLNLVRARASVGIHDSGNHGAADGCPEGANMNVMLVLWSDVQDPSRSNILNADTRLKIPADHHRDASTTEGTDGISWNVTTIAPGESMSIQVKQVGSTFPGEDLVVDVFMTP
jgi:hypothetical protein